MNRLTSIAVLSIALATGCSEFDLRNQPGSGNGSVPDILVDPPALTYGTLSSGAEEVQTFSVQNIGDATLNVDNIVIGSGLAFTVLGPETQFDLEPGASTTVDVAFSPMGADENFGQVLVLSDDPDTPEAPVDLLGYGAIPDLVITPASYNFGEAFVPCGDTVELTLENAGSEDLVIDDLAYTSGGQLSVDLQPILAQLPLTLAPGESRKLTVNYAATTSGSDTGVLEVWSNDPAGVETADQNGEGAYAAEAAEQFTEPGVPAVDVMFLIDQSCSMEGDNTDDIELGIPPFLAELQSISDWQLIQVTDPDACSNGGIIDSSTPNAANLLINNAFNAPSFPFGSYDTEALLKHAASALAKTGPGQCNAGFLRPGALLHIIVASDEPEQSGQPASFWVNEFRNYVSAPDYVKVSSIVDLSNCELGGAGYIEAANITGGAVLDICNSSWGAQMTDIASEVLAGIRTYNLADNADDSSIVVTVNGVPTTDWDYNAGSNSVTVNNPPVGEGDVVDITYGVLAECTP